MSELVTCWKGDLREELRRLQREHEECLERARKGLGFVFGDENKITLV